MGHAVPGAPQIPLIEPGDDLPALIAKAAQADGFTFADGDVAVVAQKAVSKAEGRIVRLAEVVQTPRAQDLARHTGRDARLCQLYLNESAAILEVRGRHVVTLHRLGFVGTGRGWTSPMSLTALRVTRFSCPLITMRPPAPSAADSAS